MALSRRRYSREFKLEAVRLLIEGDRGLAQTARDLNINRTMLSGWRKQYLEDPEGAFLGSGRRKRQDEDLKKLRREIEELREEREILKKRWHTTPRTSLNLQLHPESCAPIPGEQDVPGYGCFSQRLLCMEVTTCQSPSPSQSRTTD